jgi:hypothetical protein
MPRLERSLRAIVVSVLTLPAVVASACDRRSSSDRDGAAPDAAASAAEPASGDADAAIDRGPCAPAVVDAAPFNDDSGCSVFLEMPCGLPPDADLRGACIPSVEQCANWCESAFRCQLAPDVTCDDAGVLIPDAHVYLECIRCATGSGRRPRGLAIARRARTTSPLGAWFARAAYLEAASVYAFRDLERSLATLGAPRRLRSAARTAANDETRHATVTRRLARRFGASPATPRVIGAPPPALEELLIDNAVEGCVGETYGALVAMWQAARAGDPEIAREMHAIATDEIRHAELSWAFLRWGTHRLSPPARRRLRRRIRTALHRLRLEVAAPVDPTVIARAGAPSPGTAGALIARLAPFVRSETDRRTISGTARAARRGSGRPDPPSASRRGRRGRSQR